MVPKNPSTEQVIKHLEQYKTFLNDIPNKEDAETFRNIWETLIIVIENNSMSGGGKSKCQKCIPNSSGTKCQICGRSLGSRSSRRARSRTRTGKNYDKRLQNAITTKGRRLKVPSELLEHTRQLGADLVSAATPKTMNNLVNNDLYSFVLRLFNQAQAELDMSSGFQAKTRETRFYNLYLYVFIPLSCLICTGANGYLWYNFCNTFIWIIEEHTSAVDYKAGISGRRTASLEQAKRTHVLQTGVENFRQMNEAEQQQQRLTWLQQIRQYLPGTTSKEIEAISQTALSSTSSPISSPTSSPNINQRRSFRQWGHDMTFLVKNWFINRKYEAQNNFVVQMMDQFGQLARSTGNFIYILPLISQLYIIKKHIDWGRRVMKDHPSYGGPEKDDRDPRGPPKKDPRDPGSDGSSGSSSISARGGRRRKRRKSRRKSRRKKKKSKRKRRKIKKTRKRRRKY